MYTLLQLQKRRADALKAVASAATTSARDKAAAELDKATLELATFKTRLESKTIKTVKKEERYEEEDEEEEEEEDSDEDEKADDEPKQGDDDDDDDDDDSDDDEESTASEEEEDDEEEDEDEDEDEKARASAIASAKALLASVKRRNPRDGGKELASAKALVRSVKAAVAPKSLENFRSLKAACQRVTGKKSMHAIIGALDALKATAESTQKLSADVERIKARSRRDKVDSMLATARKEGKVTKAEVAQLRSQGLKDPKWLKAYVECLPKRVRLVEEGASHGKSLEGGVDGEERRASALDAQKMSADQRKMVELMASEAGQSFDDFLASMGKTATNKSNGAARRGQ